MNKTIPAIIDQKQKGRFFLNSPIFIVLQEQDEHEHILQRLQLQLSHEQQLHILVNIGHVLIYLFLGLFVWLKL